MVKIGDVVTVPEIPTVVQLAVVEQLSAALDARTAGKSGCCDEELATQLSVYLEQYFLVDARTRAAVQTILSHLATHRDRGEAFFVKGVYGSGKSHLLAVLKLLLEHPLAWEFFRRTHSEFAQCGERYLAQPPLLAVTVALDEYNGRYLDLEDILFDQAERALRRPRLDVPAPLTEEAYALDLIDRHVAPRYARELEDYLRQELRLNASWEEIRAVDPTVALAHAVRFLEAGNIPLDFRQSRVERLGRLVELVKERGLGGVVFLIDELSVFLGSKTRADLQNQASFLQFLGQRTHLAPVWAVATLQKNIEDVGDIEYPTLHQIKDRWQTRLSLALTEARQVVSRKLLLKPDPAAFQKAVREAHRAWTGGQATRGLAQAALEETYPLHPQTLAHLEACADRFLSKTRSLIDFVRVQVAGDDTVPGVLEQPVTTLITPDVVFDHFAREIAQNPDLARYRDTIYRYYEQNGPQLFPEDLELALRLVKGLIISRLAGWEPAVREMAREFLPLLEDPNRENRVQTLLEKMYSHGSYVAVQRRRGDFADLFFVDLDFDVNETIRRRVRSIADSLSPEDGRMVAYAIDCCTDPEFPLAVYRRPTSTSLTWRHTHRHLLVHLRDLTLLSPEEAVNQAALLANPEVEECIYLWIAEPLREDPQRAAWEAALAALPDERWARSLVVWFPRPLTEAEGEQLRRDTAHELLRQDPALADNAPGAALQGRLNEGIETRRVRTENLLKQAYYEGGIRNCDGLLQDASRLASLRDHWVETLHQAAGPCLEMLFPHFRDYAPRRRIFSRACANELIRDFITAGTVQVSPASTLAGYIEDYAVPLGIAAGEEGSYRVRAPGPPLARAVLSWLPPQAEGPRSLKEVEQRLAKSEWGLVPELSHLLLAALIKKGLITALDDAQQPLPTHRLEAPLRSSIAFLSGPDTLPAELWPPLRKLAELLGGSAPPVETPAGQQALWEALLVFRKDLESRVVRLENCFADVQQALGHDDIQWLRAAEVLDRLRSLAQLIDPEALTTIGLADFVKALQQPPYAQAPEDFAPLQDLLEQGAQLDRFAAETAPDLLRWYQELQDPRLSIPAGSKLANRRDQVLQLLVSGDDVAFLGDQLSALARAFREDYTAHYLAWHHSAHAPSRFEPYLQLRTQPVYRLLERLAGLCLDVSRDLASVEEMIRQELAKRCRIFDLRSRLEHHIVCPECGLAYGQMVELRPVEELYQELQGGVEEILQALRSEACKEVLRPALSQPEIPTAARRGVETLLDRELDSPEGFLEDCAPEAVEFINQVLPARVVARRKLSQLWIRIANKNLPKGDLLRAFQSWVDPTGQIAPDEVIAVEWEEGNFRGTGEG